MHKLNLTEHLLFKEDCPKEILERFHSVGQRENHLINISNWTYSLYFHSLTESKISGKNPVWSIEWLFFGFILSIFVKT